MKRIQMKCLLIVIMFLILGCCLSFYDYHNQKQNVTKIIETKCEGIMNGQNNIETMTLQKEQENDLIELKYYIEAVPLSYAEQDYLQSACEEFDVPYALMLALIEKETNFKNVIGDSGKSFGYTQIQIKWHKERMNKIGAYDLMNPQDNFRTSCSLLSELLKDYGMERGLTAYNRGKPGKSRYATTVLKNMQNWKKIVDNSDQ